MKKQVSFKEYTISIADSGSVEVFKTFDNVKGALREIYDLRGMEYDPDWTTRQMGGKLITALEGKGESSVIVGEYIVVREDSGSIRVAKLYSNTKEALREIAKLSHFSADEGWNTRQFGSKLADYLLK